jgi:hypothetical protein
VALMPVASVLEQARRNAAHAGRELLVVCEDCAPRLTGRDLLHKAALVRKLDLLKAELAGPNPTPLERLLVERVVACWLQVQDADMRYAQAKNPSIEQGDYYQRRMDRAHRRYLSAIRTLATVRKLALPVLQVNLVSAPVNGASAGPVLEHRPATPGHHGSNGCHRRNGKAALPLPRGAGGGAAARPAASDRLAPSATR